MLERIGMPILCFNAKLPDLSGLSLGGAVGVAAHGRYQKRAAPTLLQTIIQNLQI